MPGEGDLLAGRWLVLRRGKRHLAAVEVARQRDLTLPAGAS